MKPLQLIRPVREEDVPLLMEHLHQSRRTGMRTGAALILLITLLLMLGSAFGASLLPSRLLLMSGACIALSLLSNLAATFAAPQRLKLWHELHVVVLTFYTACYGWVLDSGEQWMHFPGLVFLIPFGVLVFSPLSPGFFLRLGVLCTSWELLWYNALQAEAHFENFSLVAVGISMTSVTLLATQSLRHAWANMGQARDQLIAADRLSTLGLHTAGIAHELNTPLASAQTEAQGLRDLLEELGESLHHPEVTPADLREIHQEMSAHLRHLDLSLTRTTAFVRALREHTRDIAHQEVSTFDLREQVLGSLTLLDHRLLQAQGRCETSALPPGLLLEGDAGKFDHVIFNLVSNAMEAAPQGSSPRIEISAAREGGALLLVIQDDGPGIPEALRERIFDPLFTTRAEGTGLGLSVCRDIVEGVFGGSLVLAQAPRGARFELRLPLRATHHPRPRPRRTFVPFAPLDTAALSAEPAASLDSP